MTSALLEALKDVDDEMVAFLLDTLESNQEDQELLVPLLESYLGDNASDALNVLVSDPDVIAKAKAELETMSEESMMMKPVSFPFVKKIPTLIAAAENRAISLRQLRKIYDFIQENSNEDGYLPWTDTLEHSPTYGQKLHVHQINLYHAVEWIVKPATLRHECSLVELLADKPQTPRWFVSHAWAEPIKDFLTAVSKHAQIRGIPQDDFWWVCGYANNQHRIETGISSNDPRQTSFYRVMQQCQGVLLCLDETATPLRRIWCCFEEAMLVNKDEKKLLLDLATPSNSNEIGRTPFLWNCWNKGTMWTFERPMPPIKTTSDAS